MVYFLFKQLYRRPYITVKAGELKHIANEISKRYLLASEIILSRD